MTNGLPDLLEDAVDIVDLDVEWVQSMSDEDKQAFAYQVAYYEVEISQELKDNLYSKEIKRFF